MVSNLWTVKRIAEVTGLSTGHVSYLFFTGEIKGEKIGRAWVATDTEVKRWLSERKQELEQQVKRLDV